MLKFLLGAAAAFALVSATPATACPDCKDCPQHKSVTAEAEKKDAKSCGCEHSASKECKCGEKCACASCPVHGKKGEKSEKKS
jgi:hypothetical protein